MQLLITVCSYNFIKFSKCNYNFNVAVRISINRLSPDGFAYYAYGAYNSEFNSLFVSGRFELVEGSHITEDITNGIILSRESVEKTD